MFNREAHTYKNERLTRAAEAAYARLAGGVDGVWQHSSLFTKQTISDLAWAGVHGFAMLVLEDQLGRDEAANPAFWRRRDSLLEAIVTAITQRKARQ
jgi:hypothetical protein